MGFGTFVEGRDSGIFLGLGLFILTWRNNPSNKNGAAGTHALQLNRTVP